MNQREAKFANENRSARRVFVSFASANQKKALDLCGALEQRGISSWISCRDVAAGENYQEAIVRAIEDARAMVLVFSRAANASDEIKKELSLASRNRVPVVVVRIEKVQPTAAFAYELSTRQWIDAFASPDKVIDAIVASLGQAKFTARNTPRTRLWPVLISAVVVLLLAAGGFWLKKSRGAPAEALTVRLGGFQADNGNMPATLRDELIAAFGDDGIVRVSTATSPPSSGPDYVLGGTVRHENGQVKLISRLTNDRTGTTVWSNSYEAPSAEVTTMPRHVAIHISMVVRCGLFGTSTYRGKLSDATVADYFQYCQNVGDEPAKALDFARKVAAAVPDFSWGWSAVEIAAFNAILARPPPDRAALLRQEALRAADKAVALDKTNSEALAFKSHLLDEGRLVEREALLRQAVAARTLPCGCEHHFYGDFLMEVGRIQDAIAEYSRAVDIMALDADTQASLAQAYYAAGRADLAKPHVAAALELNDDPKFAHQVAAAFAPATGDYASGLKAINDPEHGAPPPIRPALTAAFSALQSRNPAAKARAAAEIEAMPPAARGGLRVDLLGALGANRAAVEAVVAAAEDAKRSGTRSWFFSPVLAGALRDPTFPGAAQRLGLIAYWRAKHTKPDVCTTRSTPNFCNML